MHGNDGGRTDGSRTEREQWNQVLAAHRPRLRRLVARRLGDCDGVDDVVQETLLRAYRSRATLDLSQPIGPWLTTIALRVAADAERRARRDRATALVLVTPSPDDDLAEALDRRAAVEAALRALSERHRRLLLATAVEGVRRTAIAAHERLDPAAVRAATMRARRRFRKVYTELTEERLPAAVGVLLVRLRGRLQQLEAGFAGRVDAAGCLAGVASLVMLLSAGPMHPLGEARTGTGGGTTTSSSTKGDNASGAAIGISFAPTKRSVGTWGARALRNASDGVTTPGRNTRRPVQQHVETPTGTTRATAGRDGRGAVLGFSAQDDEERTTARTYGGVEVTDCNATTSTRLKCAVIDITAAVLQAAE